MSDKPVSTKDSSQVAPHLNNQQPGTYQDAESNTGKKEFTAFQNEILRVLHGNPSYGLSIKRALKSYFGDEINHGRLYPNLDTLVENGYLKKSELDKRTNEYALTEKGRQQVEDQAANLLHETGFSTGSIDELLNGVRAHGGDD